MRLSSLPAGLVAFAVNRGLAETLRDEGVPTTHSVDPESFSQQSSSPSLVPSVGAVELVGRFNFSLQGLQDSAAFPRVLVAGIEDQLLKWTISPGKISVTVDRVELYNATNLFASGKPASRATDGKQQFDKKQHPPNSATLNITGTELNFSIDQGLDNWNDNINKVIYANVTWRGEDEIGSTWTSPFIIAPRLDSLREANTVLQMQKGFLPSPSETISVQNATPTSDPNPPTTTTSSPSSPAPSGSGLGTGVIAGIAVGGAALLAIVGVLIWFFCFRRRKQHGQARSAEYGHHDAGTSTMMVDKEVPGISTSSPHSAYGDDGGHLHDRSSAALGSSYAPYSDHGPSAHASPAVSHAAPAVQPNMSHDASSPTGSQPTTTQYAHLVEEGMTADEIRRLEEEERALDQAIEAAGTSRAGH
ncbi:cell wall integrity and stress response component [Microdochium nivale]|nr:cell wall integrity and stress response component [Microdochium nivale]